MKMLAMALWGKFLIGLLILCTLIFVVPIVGLMIAYATDKE